MSQSVDGGKLLQILQHLGRAPKDMDELTSKLKIYTSWTP